MNASATPIESSPGRRRFLVTALALAITHRATAAPVLRIGVPSDVADDFLRFLGAREVARLRHFGGEHARRDVMELAWLLREIGRQPDAPEIQLVRINNYERLIANVSEGRIDLIGTTAWRADLEALGSGVAVSAPLIPAGRFIVGVYVTARNQAALSVRNLAHLRTLRFVSNRSWTSDWVTLGRLGIEPRYDVKTWGEMVKLIDTGRADAVLAPFQPKGRSMELRFENTVLVPIPGIGVALDGSRHLASASGTEYGRWVAEKIWPRVIAQIKSGDLRRAYEECGFYSAAHRNWTIL